MTRLDITDVVGDFPDYRVALVVAADLAVVAERTESLEREVGEVEAAVAEAWGDTPPSDVPEIKAWRQAYKRFGVKKTSYRSSVERLVRSIQQGRGLPRVNALVEAYNAVSARHLMPVGADDLDKVRGPLAFRYAREGDTFVRLGDTTGALDRPRPGEVVYADAQMVLCRRWNWHQGARSATSTATRRAVLTVQALGPAPALEAAAADLCERIARHCAGRTAWAVAHSGSPVIDVADP